MSNVPPPPGSPPPPPWAPGPPPGPQGPPPGNPPGYPPGNPPGYPPAPAPPPGAPPVGYGGYPPQPPTGFPASVPPPGYSPYGASAGSPAKAGFWSRLGALIVDGLVALLIGLPFYVVSIFFFRKAYEDCFSIDDEIYCPDGALKGGPLAIAIILCVVGALAAAIMIIRWQGQGASPGMKAVGNRLVDARSLQPIGGGRATGRYFARILSSIPCYLGFLWMLWDGNRQTWHDKMTNSIVIKG